MRDTGLVVVLDGPTMVGRSTTLAGLQRAWPEVRPGPLLEVGLDAAVAGLGPGSRRWSELIGPTVTTGRGAPRASWGPMGRELIAGLHRSVAAWLASGFDVAVDHTLLDHATWSDLVAAVDGHPMLHVGLVCDPDVLEGREIDAGRALPGLAAAQQAANRAEIRPDLVLDTTQATTQELVDLILERVARLVRER